MKNKKAIILSVIASLALFILIIGATYAYFQASGGDGTSTNLRVTTYTTDIITFEVGSNINIETNATLFSQGKGNASGTTFARATLTANNKTNSATENYSLFLNISDNTFAYSVDTNTPELILTIKDKSNNEVTSIEGLTYKTVTDGKGTTIKGFDITNKNGLLTLFNKDITTTSTTVEEWNATVTFVNYNKDQTKNAGKKFDAQLIISKDNFSDYTPNTINTLSASKSGNNLTVNLNLENGSNPIDKYYYAIEETNGLAILDSKASIKRLSNRLAVSELTYVESNNSSYTFTNIKTDANYNVYAYAVDNKKVKTNTYNYKYTSNYNLPVISKVETSKTFNSITATVTATKGTNNISKYYYSIDNGSTFTESTSNSYTFNNIKDDINYEISAYAIDKKKVKTNVYNYNYRTDNYNLPVISKVETSKTTNTITTTVTASKGTNNISKYYYSIDGGNSFVESDSNLYTFSGLQIGTYKIIVKIMDSNGKYSNIYVKSAITSDKIMFTFEGTKYQAKSGMTLSEWIKSDYNTWGYDVTSSTLLSKIINNGDNINIYPTDWPLTTYTNGTIVKPFVESNFKDLTNYQNITDEALIKIKSIYKGNLSKFSEYKDITNTTIKNNRKLVVEYLEEKVVLYMPYIFKVTDSSKIKANSNEKYSFELSAREITDDLSGIMLLTYNIKTDLFDVVEPILVDKENKTIQAELPDNTIFAIVNDSY